MVTAATDPRTLEIVERFEQCTLPELSHADHVRVAWYYSTRAELATVLLELPERLRRYAAHKGAPHHYHETITFAFICLIHERVSLGGDASWDEFAAANDDLFDRALLAGYYAAEVLESGEARRVFLLPRPARR